MRRHTAIQRDTQTNRHTNARRQRHTDINTETETDTDSRETYTTDSNTKISKQMTYHHIRFTPQTKDRTRNG